MNKKIKFTYRGKVIIETYNIALKQKDEEINRLKLENAFLKLSNPNVSVEVTNISPYFHSKLSNKTLKG